MTTNYPLGHDEDEGSRLSRQAAILYDGTTRFLEKHLKPGARVLDCGCGLGHVTAIAARIAGPRGSVVAIDRSDAGFDAARRRTAGTDMAPTAFVVGELGDLADGRALEGLGAFDAVVGRLVLMYPADGDAVLGAILSRLRPGGTFAFQEPLMAGAGSVPPAPFADAAVARMKAMFAAGSADTEAAGAVATRLEARGLRPSMEVDVHVDRSGHGPVAGWLCEILRTFDAMAHARGAAPPPSATPYDEDSLRAEARAGATMLTSPMIVGISCVLPG